MTQSGQGGEPQQQSARPAYEGIVLPADGSGPWLPGAPEERESAPVGGTPWGGQWGPQGGPQPGAAPDGFAPQADGFAGQGDGFGGQVPPMPPLPQQPHQPAAYGYPQPYPEQTGYEQTGYEQTGYEQTGYEGYDAYGAQQASGYGAPGQPQPPVPDPSYGGQSYGAPFADPFADPHAQRMGSDADATALIPPVDQGMPGPGAVPGGADAAATQYIPPVPGGADAAATQYIPPVPGGADAAATQYIPPVPGGSDAAATQYIPPVPGGSDAAATQYIPPVPATPDLAEAATQYMAPVPGGPVGAPGAPGAPGGPPAEFDGLFRTSGGPGGATGGYGYPSDAPGSTQQLPKIDEPVAPGPPAPRPHPQQGRPPQPGYHQAPPPQEPYYGDEPEGRRAPVGLIAAGVLGLAVVGLGVGAMMGNGGNSKANDPTSTMSDTAKPSASADTGEQPVDPARAQAVQLDKLLGDSGGSRDQVIAAVDNIKKCDDLDQAGSDLRDAARQREELITRLEELKVDQLPDHDKLASALTKAWKYSASADKNYAEWADQVDGSKKYCKGGHARTTSNARDGNKASGQASAYKEQAAVLWNRIAAKYDLTKRDRTKL